MAWSEGRNREAIGYHQEAVEICERLGLTDLVAVQAYHGRGETYYNNLEPARAVACYERSIELARGIGDKSYESENLMMVGYACTGYMGLADYPRAQANLEASIAIARKADLQWHMGPTLLGLDHVRACLGRYDEALEGMLKTLRWLEGLKQTRYQLIAYDLIGHLLIDQGRNRDAADQCERGLELARRTRITFWCQRIEANLAIARLRLGELDVGAALERAADYCRQNAEGHQLVRCLEGLAELALARGDAVGCLSFANEPGRGAGLAGARRAGASLARRGAPRPEAVRAGRGRAPARRRRRRRNRPRPARLRRTRRTSEIRV